MNTPYFLAHGILCFVNVEKKVSQLPQSFLFFSSEYEYFLRVLR